MATTKPQMDTTEKRALQKANAQTAACMAILEGVEFPITIDELAGMLAMIDISDEAAEVAIGRLGLSRAPDEAEVIRW